MPLARLPDGLPPGRFLPGDSPGLWLSYEPVVAPGRLWARYQEQQNETGWCPVLMAWPCATGRGHRTEDIDGVWVSAAANMRTYLLLAERARAFRADPEVAAALVASRTAELSKSTMDKDETVADLRAEPELDLAAAAARGYGYAQVNQLMVEHAIGAR